MSTFDRFNSWAKTSIMLKLATIGFIILLLLIPTVLIDDLINDRRRLRDEVQQEVASKFGYEQTFGGPVISVPYNYVTVSQGSKGPIETGHSGYAHFLPDELDINGHIAPEQRHRGIFVAVLYNAQLKVRGHFEHFNTEALNLPESALQWENALFTVGISDMTGINANIRVDFDDQSLNLGPGTITSDMFSSGASTPVDLSERSKPLNFNLSVDLNGSSGLFFRPYGATTTVNISSPWTNPSFMGNYLPKQSDINETGFEAQWEVLQLNRNYPQQGLNDYTEGLVSKRSYDYSESYYPGQYNVEQGDRFGIKLLLPVDEYSKIYRSTNYALLFIILTFLTFFFIEVLNRTRVHPIQYILIGAAVVLFYVLLLSISEHQYFDLAYWISACAITALITAYSAAVLRNAKLTALVGAMLLILYVFFYSLLQLQDYALLIGSVGLLLILSTIMFLTRNVDWYTIGRKNEEDVVEP